MTLPPIDELLDFIDITNAKALNIIVIELSLIVKEL